MTETASLEGAQESVVGVWTRESAHNYENNAKVTEEFVCPSANKFVVEFDPRCITERRYDYLEFTDVTGAKQKFDGKYNTDRWPSVCTSIYHMCNCYIIICTIIQIDGQVYVHLYITCVIVIIYVYTDCRVSRTKVTICISF